MRLRRPYVTYREWFPWHVYEALVGAEYLLDLTELEEQLSCGTLTVEEYFSERDRLRRTE